MTCPFTFSSPAAVELYLIKEDARGDRKALLEREKTGFARGSYSDDQKGTLHT
jgi:hypothetical protein